MQFALILHNLRSTYNVGAILRSAEGFGVARVYYSGYTPVFHDTRLLPHLRAKVDRQIAKTALGAEQLVPQEYADSPEQLLKKLHQESWIILGLENHLSRPTVALPQICQELAKTAKNQASEKPHRQSAQEAPNKTPHQKSNSKVALLLGEEVHGIPSKLHPYVDFFTEIPMFGQKESFNVSVAAGIALYELTRPQVNQQPDPPPN